ncbi:hypothetical protein [Glutamicibacter arilaitensis]|uniref:hypothetical protein n=1 Tax=Glutamicibacter arilaitensis TaxID=256701 RepID=UPI00384C9525
MTDQRNDAAIATLNGWLAEHGVPDAHTTPEDWEISPFQDALLIVPANQRRTNRVYLVRGEMVSAFSPSTTTFDEGYARLGNPEGPMATA